jgi:ELP3 family radical SAM enzyme/protein acetyltransferase
MEVQDIEDNPYFKHDKFKSAMNKIIPMNQIVEPLKALNDTQLSVLRNMVSFIMEKNPSKEEYNNVLIEARKKFHANFKKVDLQYMYNIICKEKGIQPNDHFRQLFQYNPFRSQSGVMVYAVFTAPFYRESTNGKMKAFSCEYNCSYCPEQPNRPRSYVDGEPGLDRSESVDYDVVKQFHSRATAYKATGHVNDKAEVIVLGGTWHSYPIEYRRTFIRDLYYAANILHESERERLTMDAEIKLNQESKCRIIGLTIETRPDRITPNELPELRRMGVTRVQLGLQHVNNRILERINRRCTAETGKKAIKLLKDNCFKVDGHWMPDLPKPFLEGANTKNGYTKDDIDWDFDMFEEDKKMFDEVLNNHEWQLDQWKIYPCEVVPWTAIYEDFKAGIHSSYGTEKVLELLIYVKSRVHKWIRLNRVIRDIPIEYIFDGIKNTNGRQLVEQMMKKRGLECKCKRCREIKKETIDPNDVHLDILKYKASGYDEYDIQYVNSNDKLIGFLRLRLSADSGYGYTSLKNKKVVVFPELIDSALIRELHVYGETAKVGSNSSNGQHLGFGSKLIQEAFRIARENNYKKISVISGEGVKPYYKKHGFIDGQYFMTANI